MSREKSLCERVIEEAKIPYGDEDGKTHINAFRIFAKYGYWMQDGVFQWNLVAVLTAPQKDLLYMLNWDKEVIE